MDMELNPRFFTFPSFPVARAACRFILRSIKAKVKQGDKCDDLVFITGIGKKHLHMDQADPNTSLLLPARDGSLREYIRQILLEDFEPPLHSNVPTRGEGMVQVTCDVLKTWINSQ